MDQFGNILTNATNNANSTYATDTTNAANAQAQANTANANVNSQGQLADQQAAKLSALGDTYSNQAQNQNNFMNAEHTQLNTIGFDPNTLNTANQNIAQETGQLGAAQNQMDATGGTRGFNAVGTANRQAGIQNQAANAIGANAKVQSNELGQANAASTLTGQDMNYQLGQNTNAINAYNNSAAGYNATMANYATQLNTLSQQAVAQGGLVGSNVANIMASANSASQALLAKYQAQTQISTQNLQNAQAGLASAQTTGQNIQNTYNNQLNTWRESTQKLVDSNNKKTSKAIANVQSSLNFDTTTKNNDIAAQQASGWGWVLSIPFIGGIVGNSVNTKVNNNIANDKSQLQQLNSNKLPNVM